MKNLVFYPGLALLLLTAGCAIRKEQPAVAPLAAPADAPQLLAQVRERARAVRRMDAVIEATMAGAPHGGRFFGSLQVEDGATESLAVRIQTYTLTGMPVLELIARGARAEVISPLERLTYLNFAGLAEGRSVDEFPLSLFNETAVPLELLLQQFHLLYGLGIDPRFRYLLTETPDSFLVGEWDGETQRREITYRRRDLQLLAVKVYQGGSVYGGMECRDYDGQGLKAFIPSTIAFYQGELKLTFSLSGVRTNEEVTSPAVEFRPPGPGRLVLLTPPVP
jgi:hypothetical protein